MKQLTYKFLWYFLWVVKIPFALVMIVLMALAIPFNFITKRIEELQSILKGCYWRLVMKKEGYDGW